MKKTLLILLCALSMALSGSAQPGIGSRILTDSLLEAQAVEDPLTGDTLKAVINTLTVAPGEGTGFFGAYKPDFFLWCMFFGLLGFYISVQLDANRRDIGSERTPDHFSYRQLIKDNWQRALFNTAIMYAALRFMPDLVGVELSQGKALFAGLGFDRLLLIFRGKKGDK